MNKSIVLCSLLLLIGNLCLIQGKITPIDEFNTDCASVFVSEFVAGNNNSAFWIASESCAGDVGNPISQERDLQVQLTNNTIIDTNGNPVELTYAGIETSVSNGAWTTAVDVGAQGTALIQWDGVDNSTSLFYGLNLDLASVASSFFFIYSADLEVTFFFRAYTSNTSASFTTFIYTPVQGQEEQFQTQTIPFSTFTILPGFASPVNFGQIGRAHV